MKRAACTLAAGLILAVAAIAQSLPPDLILLSRVKRQISAQLKALNDTSCLETVEREHQPARGKMRPLDTVRLEVLTDGKKELFASPNERKFSAQPPITYVGSGTLGDGFFGLYLKDILSNGCIIKYKGEETIRGRRAARWDLRMPVFYKPQTIQLSDGEGTVGLEGSFWADPETDDVIRLELNVTDIPTTLPLSNAALSINYARTDLGNGKVMLLPESGEYRMLKISGEADHNRIEFTHCRVFGAVSSINFGDPGSGSETPVFVASSIDDTLRSLPAGLRIAVKLRTRITDGLAVGSLIDGSVAANVTGKGGLTVAAGSPVRGRIRRLEHYTDPFPYFVVALEFTEVEVEGIRYRFYADVLETDLLPGLERRLQVSDTMESKSIGGGVLDITSTTISRAASESLWLPDLPGVAVFFVKSDKLNVPQGFRTVWKTRPLKP